MRVRKIVISSAAAAIAVLGSAAAAFAATASDTGDKFSLPAGTTLTASAKSPGLTFTGTIGGSSIKVTCAKFSASGKIPTSGLAVTLPTSPTISSCTVGGTFPATIKTNSTNGKWVLTEVDNTSSTGDAKEPNTGDKATLTIPKAGATFTSPLLAGCTITVAPSGSAKVSATFNDATAIVAKGTIPVHGTSQCGAGTGNTSTVGGTIVLNKSVHDT